MTNPAEIFSETLDQIRANAPEVGIAALSGKTPNRALKKSWAELNAIGVTLQKSGMVYKWRALHKINPKLGHAIEEVLVFGDALFTAWGKRQTPEGLKSEYIDLKQRFSKIIKETQDFAVPKVEEARFSFFGKAQDPQSKKELRLDDLDALLEEAHQKSRLLLGKTEKDLIEERAFHKAAEWYVLALEMAQRHLENVAKVEGVDGSMINDLKNSLQISTSTTSAILATTDQWLRVKEALHNKSITFLTAHENTFTIIQSHLRSWKDIENQTATLNALSEAVKTGTSLMATASAGVEQPLNAWKGELITPETIKNLSSSFSQYDKDVSGLVANLVVPREKQNQGPQLSYWDEWEKTKKDIVSPILNFSPVSNDSPPILRPTLNKTKVDLAQNQEEDQLPPLQKEKPIPFRLKEKKTPRVRESKPVENWNRLDKIIVQRSIDNYQKNMGSSFDINRAQALGWSPVQTTENLSYAFRVLGDKEVSALPPQIRSQMDYITQKEDPSLVDWHAISQQRIIPFDKKWSENFSAWMKEKDDLDWSYLMQWNDLAGDLLILDNDPKQKSFLMSEEGKAMRESIVSRLEEFLSAPNLEESTIREWGFAGVIIRHSLALGIDPSQVEKAWKYFANPSCPVDWDGQNVSSWKDVYKNDLSDPLVQDFVNQHIDEDFPPMTESKNNENYNLYLAADTVSSAEVSTVLSENIKLKRNTLSTTANNQGRPKL